MSDENATGKVVPKLDRENLKIIEFYIDEGDDEPKGCVVMHKPTGQSAVSEEPRYTARGNFLHALTTLAETIGNTKDEVQALFYCRTCKQVELPEFLEWESAHGFQYNQSVTVGDADLGTYIVYWDREEEYWFYGLHEPRGSDIRGGGKSHFLQDAIEHAHKEIAELKSNYAAADVADAGTPDED